MKVAQIRRWLMMLTGSFVMYEALWSVIQLQFGQLSFSVADTLWDLAQCALFTTAMFAVSRGFARLRGGRWEHSVAEVACMVAFSSVLIYLVDKVLFVQETSDDSFWNVIDIYVICIICVSLAIIDFERAYHRQFVAMKQEQMRLRLAMLQQQLSPHFVFNSLATLQGMIAADPDRAEGYVATLSDIMRYITENIGKDRIPVAQALGFVQSYAEMQMARFPGHFSFSIAMGDVPRGASVVPVSLQIAVENAIKHNSHSATHPLPISVAPSGDSIVVRNAKHPIATPDGGGLGIGLKNLAERYRLLGKELEIAETADYFTVKIPLIYDDESIDS